MASLNSIRPEHRGCAPPAAILAALTPAEAARRAEAVFNLQAAAAGIGEPQIAAATRAQAEKLRTALPYPQYQQEVKRRQAAMLTLPGTGDDVMEMRRGHLEGLKQFALSNPYPGDIDRLLDNEQKQVRDRMPVSKEVLKTQITKAVASAVADLETRQANLLRDIAAFKERMER